MFRHGLVLNILAATLVLAGLVRGADGPGLKDALALEEAFQDAIQSAEPSIACVLISRSEEYRRWLRSDAADIPGKLGSFSPGMSDESKKLDLANPDNVPESYGSGVVVDEKGLILTNYHVVREATKVYVRLPGRRGSYADIHAADPRSDLAVLQVLDRQVLPLRPIKMGDGGVRKGKLVLSLANPFAAGFRDGSPSASWGIISNVRRRGPSALVREEEQNRLPLHQFGTLLQTDARLNLGCSGGALIDLKGELIGLTTSVAAINGSETSGGFAVPMDAGMRRIVEVLKTGAEVEYGFLGVLPSRETRSDGVRIESVSQGSPAERAGLGEGWVVRSIDGIPVRSVEDLFLAVGMALAGSRVKLEAVRPGSTRTDVLEASLAKFHVPGKIIASKKPAFIRGLRVDYASAMLQRNGSWRGDHYDGVYVREVEPPDPGKQARAPLDAIITHVNGRPVNSPEEFAQQVGKQTGPVELTITSRDPTRVSQKVKLD